MNSFSRGVVSHSPWKRRTCLACYWYSSNRQSPRAGHATVGNRVMFLLCTEPFEGANQQSSHQQISDHPQSLCRALEYLISASLFDIFLSHSHHHHHHPHCIHEERLALLSPQATSWALKPQFLNQDKAPPLRAHHRYESEPGGHPPVR